MRGIRSLRRVVALPGSSGKQTHLLRGPLAASRNLLHVSYYVMLHCNFIITPGHESCISQHFILNAIPPVLKVRHLYLIIQPCISIQILVLHTHSHARHAAS